MARSREESSSIDSLSAEERTGTSGLSEAEIRRKMGIDFEQSNEERDIKWFRSATDAERAEELRQVVELAEAITKAADHQPDRTSAPRFPDPVTQS